MKYIDLASEVQIFFWSASLILVAGKVGLFSSILEHFQGLARNIGDEAVDPVLTWLRWERGIPRS